MVIIAERQERGEEGPFFSRLMLMPSCHLPAHNMYLL